MNNTGLSEVSYTGHGKTVTVEAIGESGATNVTVVESNH